MTARMNSRKHTKNDKLIHFNQNFTKFAAMLSKEERKERNTIFWEDFRKKMRKHKSSNGRGINWINYPTDVKDIYVRLHCDAKGAQMSFDIQPKDDGIRSILWEQMTELRKVMESEMKLIGKWNEFDHTLADRTVSRISWKNETLNFYNPEHFELIQDFFRNHIIAFDRFYQEYKEILILLAE